MAKLAKELKVVLPGVRQARLLVVVDWLGLMIAGLAPAWHTVAA